jgi:hypothetical protein
MSRDLGVGFACAMVLAILAGCTVGSGPQGLPGAVGKSMMTRTTSEPSGENCTNGGTKIEIGVDDDGDGALGDVEIDATVFLCNGADGQGQQATLEEPGENCPNGGVRLDGGEAGPAYICNGAAGANGQDGQNVTVTPEPAGANCTYGGQMLQVGSGTPAYICDGAPGATGQDGQSVAMTPEPAGANCTYGGQKLQVGGGTPAYVCNGAPGATGQDGQSVAMTPEPAGANCTYGGQKLQVGSGTPAYVCNGAPGATGADGLSVSITPEGAGTNCTYGGVKLQVGTGAPTYVCNGPPGTDGASVTMTPEPPGPNCGNGGVKLQVGSGSVTYLCNGALPGTNVPTVTTVSADPRYYDALVHAEVTNDGNDIVMARGVVFATHAAPDLHDSVVVSGSGMGAFDTFVDGLSPNVTYHVRAFATNPVGTGYGDAISFTTRPLGLPVLTTKPAVNITTTTALSGGDITDDGGTAILARGSCWSLAPAPTTADACASEGVGAGSYLALATGLTGSTTYHVRAYATNAQGTAYGDDQSFTTAALPFATVTTTAVSSIAYTTATGGGNVTGDNGSPVTSRGICWSTSHGPTTSGSKYSEAGGLGPFSGPITGLVPSTTYYVRAFAVNGAGTSYGNEVSFTTPASTAPALTTTAVSSIFANIAWSGGQITTDGGSAITAKGVCWSLNPNPTTADSKTTDGTGSASYVSIMTGLSALTQYHVRAYATNTTGTAYGSDRSFTTTDVSSPPQTVPVVGTSATTMTSSSTASSGGYVSNDGGSTVTVRGVCWSTTANPTLADSCSTDGGTGVGSFTSTITGLGGCGVVYFVRAYASNGTGTGYGNQVSVSTGGFLQVTTAAVTNIGYQDAVSGGTITDAGECAVVQKGVCWSWNPNPTIANTKSTEGPGSGPFVSSLTGLLANRTYYVRAYVTNSVGTTYGQQEVFVTATPSTPYVGQSYLGGIVFYVDGTGLHGLIAAPGDRTYGSWGCQGTSIGTGTTVGTGAGNTAAIVALCADPNTAARDADGLILNGYSDWFLPSMDEMGLMRTNLYLQSLGNIAGEGVYATSSEWSATEYWYMYPNGGGSVFYHMNKSYGGYYYRPVKAF